MPVEACIFNHNTSPFAELALRSLLASEREVELNITVSDNHSTDAGVEELRQACTELGANFLASRWPAGGSLVNSHGDAIRDFVLSHPESDFWLLVDADIVFIEPRTVARMLDEIRSDQGLWAVQARFAWAEEHRGEGASLDIGRGQKQQMPIARRDGTRFDLEFEGKGRCHPGATLVRKSEVSRSVARSIGFCGAFLLSEDDRLGGFYDTMGLASHVMSTHGLRYQLSQARVVHYFNVSYEDEASGAGKRDDCRRRLAALRDDPTQPIEPGPWG